MVPTSLEAANTPDMVVKTCPWISENSIFLVHDDPPVDSVHAIHVCQMLIIHVDIECSLRGRYPWVLQYSDISAIKLIYECYFSTILNYKFFTNFINKHWQYKVKLIPVHIITRTDNQGLLLIRYKTSNWKCYNTLDFC